MNSLLAFRWSHSEVGTRVMSVPNIAAARYSVFLDVPGQYRLRQGNFRLLHAPRGHSAGGCGRCIRQFDHTETPYAFPSHTHRTKAPQRCVIRMPSCGRATEHLASCMSQPRHICPATFLHSRSAHSRSVSDDSAQRSLQCAGERGSPRSISFKVSCAEELRGPRDFLVTEGGKQLWLLADAEAGFSGRVAVADIEAQRSASCRDFMDGYVYHGLCGHPSNPQVPYRKTATNYCSSWA